MEKSGKRIVLAVFLFIACIIFFNDAFAISRNLSWSPPTTNEDDSVCTDVAGYVIRYGTASRNYNWYINVGNITSYQIILFDDVTYFIAATAYDTSGNESDYSNEVVSYAVAQFSYYCDDDNDNFVSDYPSGYCNGTGCAPSDCQMTLGNDCDDNVWGVNITATDNNCDGVDDNCDGIPDDGYSTSNISCAGNCGYVGQLICNGGVIENTCLSMQDTCISSYYCDTDSDGYKSDIPTGYCNGLNCIPASCQLSPGTDCDDGNLSINIAALDNNCDGIDNNCDGLIDNYADCSAAYVKHLFVSDMNANGSMEAVVLRNEYAGPRVVVVDSSSGATLKQILYFNNNADAIEFVAYSDLNGNGAPEIGVLAYDFITEQTVFEIRDILTGDLVQNTQPIVLDVPTGLTVSFSDNQIVLTWQGVANASSYNIYRNGLYIGTSSLNSFTDFNIVKGEIYNYRIVAVNGNYSSDSSVEIPVEACYLPARIVGATTTYYATLQEAYSAVPDGGTMQIRAITPAQNLVANINKTVTLESGYNCDYSATTCSASFSGNVSVNNGKVLISTCPLNEPAVYSEHLYYTDGANLKLAVVGKTINTNRSHLYIIDVNTGVLEKDIPYFTNNYTPIGVAKYIIGSNTLIGILGRNEITGTNSIEIRFVPGGAVY